jgi:hypothetical protein
VVRNLVQRVVVVALDLHLYRAALSTLSILPQVIQASVGDDDTVDPRRKESTQTGSYLACCRPQKCFLIDILGIVVRASNPKRESQNDLVVVVHQLLEGGLVTALHSANQETILDLAYALHYLFPRRL